MKFVIGRTLTILSWDKPVTAFLEKIKSCDTALASYRAAILFDLKFMEVLMDYCIMQQKDIEKCALTLMKAFKEEPWNENWTYEQAYTRIDEIMSARVSRGYVVYDGDIVVSMLSGRIMTYLGFKELWVDEFSVHPDYQRQGIGTKMIEYVREQLKQETEKISYIVLNTERGYPSVKFYEANGFKADESLVFMAADV